MTAGARQATIRRDTAETKIALSVNLDGTGVAEVETDLLALRYTAYRVLADELSGKAPGPEVSVLKIRGGEVQKALTELLMEVGEIVSLTHPLTVSEGVVPIESAYMAQQHFDRRKLTIYGGSSEIQRNIIARRLLNV